MILDTCWVKTVPLVPRKKMFGAVYRNEQTRYLPEQRSTVLSTRFPVNVPVNEPFSVVESYGELRETALGGVKF